MELIIILAVQAVAAIWWGWYCRRADNRRIGSRLPWWFWEQIGAL